MPDETRQAEDKQESIARAFDRVLQAVNPTVRGVLGIAGLLVTVFALGVAAGSFRVQGSIDEAEAAIETAAHERRLMTERIATVESGVAGLDARLERADMGGIEAQMDTIVERLRRVDRVLCLQVEQRPAAECARR